jgi:hypothetical protein
MASGMAKMAMTRRVKPMTMVVMGLACDGGCGRRHCADGRQ